MGTVLAYCSRTSQISSAVEVPNSLHKTLKGSVLPDLLALKRLRITLSTSEYQPPVADVKEIMCSAEVDIKPIRRSKSRLREKPWYLNREIYVKLPRIKNIPTSVYPETRLASYRWTPTGKYLNMVDYLDWLVPQETDLERGAHLRKRWTIESLLGCVGSDPSFRPYG